MSTLSRLATHWDARMIALAKSIVSKFDNDKLKWFKYQGVVIAVANRGHRGFSLEWWGKAPPHSDRYPFDVCFHAFRYDGIADRVQYYSYRSADPARVVGDALYEFSRPSLHIFPGWLNRRTMTP